MRVAAKVRRVGHRRTPVAVRANQDMLMEERRITRDERPDACRGHRARSRPRAAPRGRASSSWKRGSSVRARAARRPTSRRTGRSIRDDCSRNSAIAVGIAGVDGAEEFLGLTMKLVQVGPDGQAADGHDEPPPMSPWSAGIGQGGSAIASERLIDLLRWTQSCPRTGGALRAGPTLPPRGAAHKRAAP